MSCTSKFPGRYKTLKHDFDSLIVYYFAKMKTIGGKSGKRQYILHSVLGQGSFGKVYHSPPYAIKELTVTLNKHALNSIRN